MRTLTDGDRVMSESRVANRTIKNRLIAWEKGKEFYDGDRQNGYGGLKYDGRMKPVAEELCKKYKLNNESSVLHLGCDRGYLLYEFLHLYPLMRVRGTETSVYARNTAAHPIRLGIRIEPYTSITFADYKGYDLVIANGPVYTLSLGDAVQCLREIQRVGRNATITLAIDSPLMRKWSLLGTTFLSEEEWEEVLKYAGYTGDYKFVTAESLELCES